MSKTKQTVAITSKYAQKNRTVIPPEVRHDLKLENGDIIVYEKVFGKKEWRIRAGKVTIVPK
jgi:bifunctional DNA-binding transcriptional regulator/antitoxin component of YhaV-PrlF toxin-antitoxin module